MRAATISLAELQVRLLFEGGYYSGCGFYSNKYGIQIIKITWATYLGALLHILYPRERGPMGGAPLHWAKMGGLADIRGVSIAFIYERAPR